MGNAGKSRECLKFLENAHNLEIANKWKMLENLLNLENTRKSEKYWEMLENP